MGLIGTEDLYHHIRLTSVVASILHRAEIEAVAEARNWDKPDSYLQEVINLATNGSYTSMYGVMATAMACNITIKMVREILMMFC